MTADPDNQRAGRVSMSQGPRTPTLTPLPVAVGQAVCKGKLFIGRINLPNPGNGSLPFYLACILGGTPRAIKSLFVNAQQMHTRACACFLACF